MFNIKEYDSQFFSMYQQSVYRIYWNQCSQISHSNDIVRKTCTDLKFNKSLVNSTCYKAPIKLSSSVYSS